MSAGHDQLLHASAKRLDALGVAPGLAHELAAARRDDVAAFTADLAARGIVCIARSDPGYPAPLRELHDPPLAVFAMGAGAGPPLALPGGRSASSELAGPERRRSPWHAGWRHIAAGAGMCVVSGMALGVDAAGHLGALESDGATIAVLGCGPDVAYPRTNAGLYRRIVESGLVLSEYAPGTPPAPWRFPARNRLIAALSDAVLVVEARARSGALITADHALDLGRDVLAVPGWAGSPAAAGTNGLLKAGAGMIENEDDLAAWLGPRPALAGCAAGRGRRARRRRCRRPGAHRGAGRTARPAGPRAGSGPLPARAGRLDRPRRIRPLPGYPGNRVARPRVESGCEGV